MSQAHTITTALTREGREAAGGNCGKAQFREVEM